MFVFPLLAPAAMPQASLAAPFAVETPVRLAITPDLDGTIQAEEWDPIGAAAAGTFFQWEPGRLYWAASAPQNQEIIVSLDYNADGWLVGDDNLQMRFRLVDGEMRLRVETLDATDPNGPTWKPGGVLPETVKYIAAVQGSRWTLEASYTPSYSQAPAPGKRIGMRMDVVPQGFATGEAFLPRSLAFLVLQLDSSLGLPRWMSWRPQFRSRSTAREDRFQMSYSFRREDGDVQPLLLSIRGEGLARAVMGEKKEPFPPFGTGRVNVEFGSTIATESNPGWRVMRAEVSLPSGEPIVLRSSFRIAPLLDFSPRLPFAIKGSQDAQIIRGSVQLQSQFNGRVEGQFELTGPEEWTVTRGKKEGFLIYHPRGTAQVPVEFIVPRNTVGFWPLKMKATVGETVIEQTIFVSIE